MANDKKEAIKPAALEKLENLISQINEGKNEELGVFVNYRHPLAKDIYSAHYDSPRLPYKTNPNWRTICKKLENSRNTTKLPLLKPFFKFFFKKHPNLLGILDVKDMWILPVNYSEIISKRQIKYPNPTDEAELASTIAMLFGSPCFFFKEDFDDIFRIVFNISVLDVKNESGDHKSINMRIPDLEELNEIAYCVDKYVFFPKQRRTLQFYQEKFLIPEIDHLFYSFAFVPLFHPEGIREISKLTANTYLYSDQTPGQIRELQQPLMLWYERLWEFPLLWWQSAISPGYRSNQRPSFLDWVESFLVTHESAKFKVFEPSSTVPPSVINKFLTRKDQQFFRTLKNIELDNNPQKTVIRVICAVKLKDVLPPGTANIKIEPTLSKLLKELYGAGSISTIPLSILINSEKPDFFLGHYYGNSYDSISTIQMSDILDEVDRYFLNRNTNKNFLKPTEIWHIETPTITASSNLTFTDPQNRPTLRDIIRKQILSVFDGSFTFALPNDVRKIFTQKSGFEIPFQYLQFDGDFSAFIEKFFLNDTEFKLTHLFKGRQKSIWVSRNEDLLRFKTLPTNERFHKSVPACTTVTLEELSQIVSFGTGAWEDIWTIQHEKIHLMDSVTRDLVLLHSHCCLFVDESITVSKNVEVRSLGEIITEVEFEDSDEFKELGLALFGEGSDDLNGLIDFWRKDF
ncbi:hypothetical protein HK096_004845 [Nowakowskiella sp. JEL0078]|nr:hypothetical protein HK096_004845 [Nowakowskiella sp. JEL0078]